MHSKQRHTLQRKRTSDLSYIPKQILPLKLFPVNLNYEHLEKRIETYTSFSVSQLKHILNGFIDLRSFKNLATTSLQLDYLYRPIIDTLDEEYAVICEKCKIREIIEVLVEGKFYRKLPRENQATFIGNSRNTPTNVNCLIAATLTFASGKLSLHQMTHIIKVFGFQQKLNEANPSGVLLDYQKVLRILKKLSRSIKPMEFKQWIDDFKRKTSSDKIQSYQFLYLVTLTNKNVEQNSYQFLSFARTGESKSVAENNQVADQEQKQSSGLNYNPNALDQNKKFRLKSLDFQQSRVKSAKNVNFTEIKNQIHSSQEKMKERKKTSSLITNFRLTFELKFKQPRSHSYSKFNFHLPNFSPLKYQKTLHQPNRKQNIKSQNHKNTSQIDLLLNARKIQLQQNIQNGNSFNKQNLPIIIKGRQKTLITGNKKKLVLSHETNKISQKFNQVIKDEEAKINKRLNDIMIIENSTINES